MGSRRLGVFAYNTDYTGTTGPESIWATMIGAVGAKKYTLAGRPGGTPYITYAGPCTSMNLYEIAARITAAIVCGGDIGGCAGRQGIQLDCCSGMEGRWGAEVGIAAAGMKLEDANELVKTIVSKYEDRYRARNPPPGKTFPEIYDTEKLVPSKEYVELYEKTRNELLDLGLDMDRHTFKL